MRCMLVCKILYLLMYALSLCLNEIVIHCINYGFI